MKLIAGLGNPGKEYINTRHNAGFLVAERLASMGRAEFNFDSKLNSQVARCGELLITKPQTFMNKSGESVSKAVHYFKIHLDDLIVVHDDVDLPLGEVRFQKGRGAAGHKGVQDVINSLGSSEFWRLRIGIGRSQDERVETEDWVLTKFSPSELEILNNIPLDIG